MTGCSKAVIAVQYNRPMLLRGPEGNVNYDDWLLEPNPGPAEYEV